MDGLEKGDILLADEISQIHVDFGIKKQTQNFDKDVFRRDLGSLKEVYEEILSRLEAINVQSKSLCNVKRKCS